VSENLKKVRPLQWTCKISNLFDVQTSNNV